MSSEEISSLQARIDSLEKNLWYGKNVKCTESNSDVSITAAMRRARRHVEQCHSYSSKWVWCPPNYYTLSLDERKRILGAHTTSQLCKACLFENKNYTPEDIENDANNADGISKVDLTNSRYYLVVVQYVESINTQKLCRELRGLRPPGSRRFDQKYFSDLRLAPEEVSMQLTGYEHNAVSPFGLLDSSIPIIVCKSILCNVTPKFIWMGGGHKDLKLGMAVSEFAQSLKAIVLDVSDPRSTV